MILPVSNALSHPIAYAGGQASTAKPSFGNALQASMAKLQATNPGVTSLFHHRHHGSNDQSVNPGAAPSASGTSAASSLSLPAI